ncbi:hypothetical protein [Polyangium sp. y55x31]|uniref:hypothetical protein n=1 Tax=Polyangium sp. y55x31 TaxID=3042688 RepID=UPI00248252F7|nr:hypothetical protein [Polyangium sp. y55x31]MDI1475361.1 hypothetical protein [Polyangium sp. y55x31]
MTRTLRFSTSLASAFLVLLMAVHASGAEPSAPARGTQPRKHSLSASFGLTPLYAGVAMGYYDGGGDAPHDPDGPVLLGLSGDYMYSFGLVRLGVGLRYAHTWDAWARWTRSASFAHELGASALLSLGGTTRSGVEIAATLGLGMGRAWMPDFGLFPPSFGGIGELLFSAVIPVHPDADLLLRTGLNVALYMGNMTQEGEWPRPDAYLLRAYMPLEVGFRKRF